MGREKVDRTAIENALVEAVHGYQSVLELHTESIEAIASTVADALHAGHKLLLFGNGGSAAQAQHIAAEFVGRFRSERRALPAIALTTDTSILTAIANDYSFERVFARQVEALVQPGDVVVGLSTSGTSRNVIEGIEAATSRGARTIGFTGARPSPLAAMCQMSFIAPSESTARVQELHLTVWHIICDAVEQTLIRPSGKGTTKRA